MKVEAPEKQSRGAPRRRRRRVIPVVLLLAGLATVATGALALRTERVQRWLQEASGAPSRDLAMRAAIAAPANFASAQFSSLRAPRLQIDLKFKHLHEIHEKRNEALATGTLASSPDDFAPASIVTPDGSFDVRMRLAEAPVAQLLGEKWPLRIHVKDDGQAFGIRRFELFDPARRGNQAETIFLEHLRREDVLAPRYFFVDTVFNGKALGLFAFEESLALELLESQQRRDGVMLRLRVPLGYGQDPDAPVSARGVEIVPIRAGHVAKSKKLGRNLETATRRLRAYLDGELPADVVFDTELMGRYLAVCETWGALNSLRWENLRFYFNPLTALLEPVGIAGNLHRLPPNRRQGVPVMTFAALLLEDEEVRASYLRTLERSRVALGEDDPQGVAEREDRWLTILHRNHPLLTPLHLPTAAERIERIGRIDAERLSYLATRGAAKTFDEKARRAVIPIESVEQNLARHAFLGFDAKENRLEVKPGSFQVDGSIFLPEGVGLRIPAGVVLRFERDNGIVARGPLLFEGTADAPVVLEGPASRKRSKLWSGVYVLESDAPSVWRHVVVRNTGGFDRKGWDLPGGAVFRKTKVKLDHCRVLGNRTEEAVNMVRSTFDIRDLEVHDARDDALDLDYSKGTMWGGVLEDANGDGIDLGTSELDVVGTHLFELRDKAVVVGERSRLDARGLVIRKADIGIASKNGSHATVRDSTLSEIGRVALLAYANRPELGRGVLISENNTIVAAARVALSELGSEIVMDGTVVPSEDIRVASLEDLVGSE